jgi:hypothetical protein
LSGRSVKTAGGSPLSFDFANQETQMDNDFDADLSKLRTIQKVVNDGLRMVRTAQNVLDYAKHSDNDVLLTQVVRRAMHDLKQVIK